MDFGRQVGVENRAEIDPKRHRKSDEKKKVNLGRLGRVLGRFKGSVVPGAQLCLAPGNFQFLRKKGNFLEENYVDTQLGAFGPGADPTRSEAASPPPRQDRYLKG